LPPFLVAYPIGYGLLKRARAGKPDLAKSAKIIDFSMAISFATGSKKKTHLDESFTGSSIIDG
jgi:hypothetical protein